MEIFDPNKAYILMIVILPGSNFVIQNSIDGLKNILCKFFVLGVFLG